MDLKIKNQIALVTGSTAGIGFAIAQGLAQEGATVYVNGRTEERVSQAISRIEQSGVPGTLKPAVFDFSNAVDTEKFIQEVNHLDILINNLGYYEAKDFEDITDEDWMKIFEVNVLSGVRLSRAYLPKMLKHKAGRIIFISSESAVQIPVEMIHYGMTKTAQVAIARGLAEKTAHTAVTVNSILVGPTRSEGVETFIHQLAKNKNQEIERVEQEFFKTTRPTSLLQRFETTEEIAHFVVFISSPLASGVNGAALRVEGGLLRSIL